MVIGNGADDNHLHIHITSKKLLSNASEEGIHHIDGTYRITSYGYPLINYGVSDKCGQFHPATFVLTSHETIEDFKIFYEALIDICRMLRIKYKPVYIMQDACPASKEAILLFFPNVIILMCYFHVLYNVGPNLKNLI